jgi:hypothetical protein
MEQDGSKKLEIRAKTVGILQPGYLPWLGFFEQMHHSDIFVLYDDVQFEKGSWRNRNRIKGPGGPVWLTVPVFQKGLGLQLIRDVLINTAVPWQKRHVKSIKQHYGKATFFTEYSEGLLRLLDKPWKYLLDLDIQIIRLLAGQLGISTPIVLASDLQVPGTGVERLVRIVRHLEGAVFYEGSAGRNYIDAGAFEREGIRLVFQDYAHPVYPQLHQGFLSHLSVIDLLFNCGPDSLRILTSH